MQVQIGIQKNKPLKFVFLGLNFYLILYVFSIEVTEYIFGYKLLIKFKYVHLSYSKIHAQKCSITEICYIYSKCAQHFLLLLP